MAVLRGGGEEGGGDDGAQTDAGAAAIQEECLAPAEQPAAVKHKSYRRNKPLYKIKADGTQEIFSANGTLLETRQPDVCPPSQSSSISTPHDLTRVPNVAV